MPTPHLAWLALGLAADVTPAPTSPTAEIITVVCSGVVGILVAVTGLVQVRRRKAAEADAAPAPVIDMEDRPTRLRERLTALETRVSGHDRELVDLREQTQLHRAIDVANEAAASPRRRRQEKP